MSDVSPFAPGQISLSPEEFDWMKYSLGSLLSSESPGYIDSFVRGLFAELNRSRLGDAVGAVRRSECGSLAVREQDADTGELSWNVTYHQETRDTITAAEISEWDTIKRSSWHDRLVDQPGGGVA